MREQSSAEKMPSYDAGMERGECRVLLWVFNQNRALHIPNLSYLVVAETVPKLCVCAHTSALQGQRSFLFVLLLIFLLLT